MMRETTGQPEGVEAGTVRLVGSDPVAIFGEVFRQLVGRDAYAAMARSHNPFGESWAARRIASIIASDIEPA